mmetsp:Transcript_43558/g.78260  ORF Transcript_43558/g.78260 Transcript_43558/m.78260 type:complete len:352 (+) Transcript_43558:42-1097(+)
MNKARAMLDALMGPGRDTAVDKTQSKTKFKEDSVCKGFLIGLCPYASENLGGKRGFKVCDKIHSEVMKQQFEESAEVKYLRPKYEGEALPILEGLVRDCDLRVLAEKERCRRDWQDKKPAMPKRFYSIKKEREALIQEAEALADDKVEERALLMQKAEELNQESIALVEAETKKELELATPEEVCDICATCYQGPTADAAHRAFRIHTAFKAIRAKLDQMKPQVEEWSKTLHDSKKEEKDGEKIDSSKTEKKDEKKDDKKSHREKDRERDRSKERDHGSYRDRDRDRERGRDRSEGRDGRDRKRGRSDHDRDDGRGRDRGGRSRAGRDDSRGRGGGSGRYRSRSRDRRRGR